MSTVNSLSKRTKTTLASQSCYTTSGVEFNFPFTDVVDYYDSSANAFWVFQQWSQQPNCYIHTISGVIIELLDGDLPILFAYDTGKQVLTDQDIPPYVVDWIERCNIIPYKLATWEQNINNLTAWMAARIRSEKKQKKKPEPQRSYSRESRSRRERVVIDLDDDNDSS